MIYRSFATSRSFKLQILFVTLFLLLCCQSPRRSASANVFRSYALAIEQFKEKNYQEALLHINEAIKANNRIAQYYEIKGDILIASAESARALKAYNSAKDIRLSPGILIKIGQTYYKLNDIDSAVKNFKTAYAQKPEQLEILLLLVNCFIQQKEYELALNQLQEYTKQTKKLNTVLDSDYYIMLGKVNFEKGLYRDCVNAVEQGTRMTSRNGAIFYLMALFKEGMFDKAYNLVTNDFRNILLESDIHFFRGFYYYSVENFTVAKTQLELSINGNTKFIEAYNMLSVIYEKEGSTQQLNELEESAKAIKSQRIINMGI